MLIRPMFQPISLQCLLNSFVIRDRRVVYCTQNLTFCNKSSMWTSNSFDMISLFSAEDCGF